MPSRRRVLWVVEKKHNDRRWHFHESYKVLKEARAERTDLETIGCEVRVVKYIPASEGRGK